MIRLAALSAYEAASVPARAISSFKMTAPAVAVLLSLSLTSAGALAQSFSSPDSGRHAELLSAQNLSAPGPEEGGYRPLVLSTRLLNGLNGLVLDLVMDEQVTAECVLSSLGRKVQVANGDSHFRYDLIPDQERVSVLRFDYKGSALYDLLVINSNLAYDAGGRLVNVELSESLDHNQGAYLGAVFEALLKVLADDETQLLRRLSGQEQTLLNVSAEQASLTIYSDSDPIRELFRVEIDKDNYHQIVVLDPDWVQQSELQSKSQYRGGALKLVAVLESYKGSLSSVAMNYLRDVVNDIDKERLKDHLRQLGRVGEVGLNPAPVFAERGRWQVNFRRMPVSLTQPPAYQLLGTSDRREVMLAVQRILNRVDAVGVQMRPRITINDDLYWQLYREWDAIDPTHPRNRFMQREYGLTLDDLFDEPILFRAGAGRVVEGEHPYQIHYGVSNWLIHYLGEQSLALLGGVAVGGAVQAGLDIHKEYQNSGRLPGSYTEQEQAVLMENASNGALRGGLNAAASFNLTKGLGVPSVMAGAIVGAGNSLYDSYSEGKWADAGMLVRAGAVSAVASAGSVIGAGIGSTIALPLSQTTGALTGSLMGHYIYNYVEDNYDAIKNTIKDSFEYSYQADPQDGLEGLGLWM